MGTLALLSLLGCRAILDIHDPPPDQAETVDAGTGTDANAPRGPLPAVPSCAGSAVPLQAFGTTNYVAAAFEGDGGASAQGPMVIDLLYESALNTDVFPDEFPLACDPDNPVTDDTVCVLPNLGIGNFAWTDSDVTLYGGVPDTALQGEIGALGADLIAETGLTTIAPAYGKLFVAKDEDHPCTEAQLSAAGFLALPADGYYTRDESKLRPFSEVRAGAQGSVPNVPTISATIGGTKTLVTIDTELNDEHLPGIIVNTPLLLALQQSERVQRTAARDIEMPNCFSANKFPYDAYTLADGAEVVLTGSSETATVRFPAATTIYSLKSGTALNDNNCQQLQVETWTVPAARFQGSFLSAVGILVIDGANSRLWVPRR